MTETEIIAIIQKLANGEDETDEEAGQLIASLEAAVPHVNISDMIFYPEREQSISEIVDEAMRLEAEATRK